MLNRSGMPGVEDLAELAHMAIGCEAIAIVATGESAAPRVIDVGVGGARRPAVRRALLELTRVQRHAPALSESSSWAASLLLATGYQSFRREDLRFDGQELGAMFALSTDIASTEDDLLPAFARHVSLALAAVPSRSRADPPVPAGDPMMLLDSHALTAADFTEFSQAVHESIAPLFGAALTGLMIWDPQREALRMVPGSFEATPHDAATYTVASVDPRSNAARVFSTGRSYLSNDAASDPGILQQYVKIFGIHRVMSVALKIGPRVVGILHIANKPSDFTMADLDRAEQIAPRMATLLELATGLLEERRQHRLGGILRAAAEAIASGKNVQEFLTPVVERFCGVTDAAVCVIAEDKRIIVVWPAGTAISPGVESLLERASERRQSHLAVIAPSGVGDAGCAVYSVPVILEGRRVGTIATFRGRADPFALDEQVAFQNLARLAELGVAGERYRQERAAVARQHERQRIADDLHDEVAQLVFGAGLALDVVLKREDLDDDVIDSIRRARSLLTRSDAAIRTAIAKRSMLPASDVVQRLSDVVETVQRDFDLPIRWSALDGAAELAHRISRSRADVLVRVAHECLINAAKHAEPYSIELRLSARRRDRLLMTVMDDGVGSAGRRRRERGLASLRRRVSGQGGTLRIYALPTGTKITAGFPLA